MTPIRVALADDHKVVTRSLKAYLESFPDMRVVGIADHGEDLLAHLDEWAPDVVIQDLLMPGGIDGIEARMMGVLRAGAVGYVRKDAEPETLLAAVRAVSAGRTYLDPTIGRQLARVAPSPDDLTPREIEVLRYVAMGRSNRDIALVLGVGEETIKSHVGNLLAKLGVENRAQAAVQALKRGLISLEDL
jgi:NarL family two-component system response regulator LiaR